MKVIRLRSIVLGLLMVVLLGAGMVLASQFNRPLGPEMTLATETVKEQAAAQPAQPAALTNQKQAAPPSTATAFVPAAAAADKKFCGNNGKLTILVVGSDADPQLPPPGSDLVRYVQVDFDLQKVTVFTFPRALWLETKHLADVKIDATTLGRTYDYRYQAAKTHGNEKDEKKLSVAASQEVAQTVMDNFALRPDHYVVVNLSTLPKLVDAVGGVTINNPEKLVTHYEKVYTFEVGEQSLDGSKAASYVRFIDETHSDWDRIARQNLVLNALYKKLEEPATLPKIPAFFTELVDSFVTDLSAENITDLTCVLQSVPDEQVIQEKVHPDMVSPGPQGSQLPDLEKIKALLQSLGLVK